MHSVMIIALLVIRLSLAIVKVVNPSISDPIYQKGGTPMDQRPCSLFFDHLARLGDSETIELAQLGLREYQSGKAAEKASKEEMELEFLDYAKLVSCVDHRPTRSEYALYCIVTGKRLTPNEWLSLMEGGDDSSFQEELIHRYEAMPAKVQEGIYDYAIACMAIDREFTDEERWLYRALSLRRKIVMNFGEKKRNSGK